MKILITGATGLVGKELIALLLENGYEIHYLTTSQSKIESKPHYQGFYWNPEQSIIDENCLMGVDAIVHLAGATVSKRWTTNYKQEIIESRTLSSNLLYSCLKNHPNEVKQIVSASAIGIYPDSFTQVYTEDDQSVDDSFLGQVVVKWEESVDVFSRLNIKVCKLRTGLVLAKKGGALTEMLKPIKMGLGSPFGSGDQVQSWIHVEDLARMYLFAIQNQWEGIFNAVAPNPVTNAELTKTIAKTIHKPLFMPSIPKFIMKLVLGEMHQLLFSSQHVSSVKAEKNGFQFRYRDLTKTLDNLLA